MKRTLFLLLSLSFLLSGCGTSEGESTTSCAYQINGQNRIGWTNGVTKTECKSLANGGWYSTGVSEDTASTMNYRCSYGTCPW